jgi:ABC-2 type transport system permease protein
MAISKPMFIKFLVNCGIIFPILYAFVFGYLQSHIYFGTSANNINFLGNILLIMLQLSFNANIGLLFDLEGDRFIDYQISILSPRLVLIERALFDSLFTFIVVLPFYPISKLILGNYFQTAHISIPATVLMLFLGSILTCTYHLFLSCTIPNTRLISRIWARGNLPLMTFGGFWLPWYIMNEYSATLGTVTLFNPFLYITEGLRQAINPNPLYFSLGLCCIVLLGFSALFMLGALYFFKRKVDHI